MFLENWHRALVVLVMLLGLTFVALPARAIEFSVAEYRGSDWCVLQAQNLGVKHCVSYIRLGSSSRYNPAELPDDFHATVVIKLSEDYDTPHAAMIDGQYDRALRELGEKINADGRPVTIRFMPEPNSFWNYDSAYRDGQTTATFREAFRHGINVLRSVVQPELIRDYELNLNYASFGYDKKRIDENDFAEFNPGPGYVTIVSFSGYNRCGIDYDEIRYFDVIFTPAIAKAKEAFPGVPLGIAEIGSTPYCDVDLVSWWSDALAKAEAAGLVRVGLFLNPNPDISDNDRPERWDAIYTDHLPEFQQLLQRYGAGAPVVREGAARPSERGDAGAPPRETGSTMPSLTRSGGPEWRYSGWAEFGYPLTGINYNAGESSITGEPFGSEGATLRGNYRFGAFWDLNPRVEFGISGLVTGAYGSNEGEFWNRRVAAGLEVGFGLDTSGERVDYSRTSFTIRCLQFHHFTAVPDNQDRDGLECGAYVTHVFGGRLKR